MTSGARPGSLVPPRNGTSPGYPTWMDPNENPYINRCVVTVHYTPIVAVIFGVYIAIGLLYTFAGYRFFKITMFLTGFIFACSLVYLICLQGELLPSYGNAAVAALAGLLFGLITMLVQYVGLFISGLHTGILMGLAGLITADHLIETTPKGQVWLCIAVLLGCALTCAIFNLYFRKGLTIVGSSLYGGAILAVTSDYFLENLSLLAWVWQRATLQNPQPPPCWFSWIVLGSWPFFALTGILIQSCITGRGQRHEEEIHAGRKMARVPKSMKAMTKMDRAEMRQNKYRYLYQVRTAHGDIISQNFVQQMQRKENNDQSGECSTLQSDATHLTMLPDSHLVVLTESEDDLSHIGRRRK